MDRTLDIIDDREQLNSWVLKSIELFGNTPYLDDLLEVYPLESAVPPHLNVQLKKKNNFSPSSPTDQRAHNYTSGRN